MHSQIVYMPKGQCTSIWVVERSYMERNYKACLLIATLLEYYMSSRSIGGAILCFDLIISCPEFFRIWFAFWNCRYFSSKFYVLLIYEVINCLSSLCFILTNAVQSVLLDSMSIRMGLHGLLLWIFGGLGVANPNFVKDMVNHVFKRRK